MPVVAQSALLTIRPPELYHVFVSNYSDLNVTKCYIVNEDTEWASDHLPIRTQYNISLPETLHHSSTDFCEHTSPPRFARVDWEKVQTSIDYQNYINQDFHDLSDFHSQKDNIDNCDNAQCFVDKYYDVMVKSMHKSCTLINVCNSQSKSKHRRVPWWSSDCTIARDKVQFWRYLWIKCDRNRHSNVFHTYKFVKKVYRNVRRQALSNFHRSNFNIISSLFKYGNSKKFWKRVLRSKASNDINFHEININSLTDVFEKKFSSSNQPKSEVVKDAEAFVNDKYNDLKDTVYQKCRFSTNVIVKFIKKLKAGRAPGFDGITPEHLKHSVNTRIPELLCGLFNTCVNYGVIPDAFKVGILIPILKKSNLDTMVPGNYRPITLSSVTSKLLEYSILEDTSTHEFSDLQFGFVEGRSAQMAICSTVDVIKYFNNRGSPVYSCSLDAEKAFDAIPHSVLLYKASVVLKDHWWRLMFSWYTSLNAVVKWNNVLSQKFTLCMGSRQGGLTSPFLFNLLYQELVDGLPNLRCGLRIGNYSYNVFCYADDLLLTSATATGLQKLIDYANNYVSSHGLSFNAKKSNTVIFGKCHLSPCPVWSVNDCVINRVNEIEYLGALLSNSSVSHVNRRIRKCRQAFYSLQGAGMCDNGAEPVVISHLWQTAMQPILLYSNECFDLSNSSKVELEKIQAKLVKASLGLSKFCRSSPLLSALGVRKVDCLVNCQSIKLFNSIMTSKTQICNVYKYAFRKHLNIGLLSRVKTICSDKRLSVVKIMVDKKYCTSVCKSLKRLPINDGIVDSCRTLLSNYTSGNKALLRSLLKVF